MRDVKSDLPDVPHEAYILGKAGGNNHYGKGGFGHLDDLNINALQCEKTRKIAAYSADKCWACIKR